MPLLFDFRPKENLIQICTKEQEKMKIAVSENLHPRSKNTRLRKGEEQTSGQGWREGLLVFLLKRLSLLVSYC